MCGICGCSDEQHHHEHHMPKDVPIEVEIFTRNNRYATSNQNELNNKKILTINMMSSPGSGKTSLLAQTLADCKSVMDINIIVGDQETELDFDILSTNGGKAFQINTGKVCHLDAHMISHAIEDIQLNNHATLIIENIGNLVCPAMFNLGEQYKVVLLSVTEGDNKPLKYPDMFRCADLIILTKTDLLPYVDFDIEKCMSYARRLRPDVEILNLSVKNKSGIKEWYQWLHKRQL